MYAAVLREFGETPSFDEFKDPEPGDGTVVVDVLAAGLNPVDLAMTSGKFYGPPLPLPMVVGAEGVGRLADGSRVYFYKPLPPFGSFAERALVPESNVVPLPDGADDAGAVAIGIAGMAAWGALEKTGELQQGETVLVLGASGVVGAIGVQAARHLGASRVVAAARHQAGLERALELGADAVVDLNSEDVGAALVEAAGGNGYDLVLDPLWGAPARAALDALAMGGRLVQVGNSAGLSIDLPAPVLRSKLASIRAHTGAATTPPEFAATYSRMAELVADGKLEVPVERMSLRDVASAWERQASSPHAKLVLSSDE